MYHAAISSRLIVVFIVSSDRQLSELSFETMTQTNRYILVEICPFEKVIFTSYSVVLGGMTSNYSL